MTDAAITSRNWSTFGGEPAPRRVSGWTASGAAVLAVGVAVAAWVLERPPTAPRIADGLPVAAAPASKPPRSVIARGYGPLLDPEILGAAPLPLDRNPPLASAFEPPVPVVVADAAPDLEPDIGLPAPAAVPLVAQVAEGAAAPAVVENVPLPTPRPPDVEARPPQPPFRTARPAGRASRAAVPAAPPPDNRNFFQKLFGMPQPSGPVLAYAAPEDGFFGGRGFGSIAAPADDRLTAIYDIAAHTVTLPNGTRLEAHSGLGDRLDDPRHVSDRNRGATPPHVYELTPREQLFHGVRALRLNPVGGGGVFGRTGLLAHSFMLGPNGDSNGCVSFRNYEAFLRAYMNGEVKRLVVVARAS